MKNKTYNTINSPRNKDQKIYINHNKNREGKINGKKSYHLTRFTDSEVGANIATSDRVLNNKKTAKNQKIPSKLKVTVFLFFHIQKNR